MEIDGGGNATTVYEKKREEQAPTWYKGRKKSWVHRVRWEYHTVGANENYRPSLDDLGLRWEAAQYLGAANLDVGRRLRSKEHADRICLGEVLAVDSEHL